VRVSVPVPPQIQGCLLVDPELPNWELPPEVTGRAQSGEDVNTPTIGNYVCRDIGGFVGERDLRSSNYRAAEITDDAGELRGVRGLRIAERERQPGRDEQTEQWEQQAMGRNTS
jgi:hypothetical protein